MAADWVVGPSLSRLHLLVVLEEASEEASAVAIAVVDSEEGVVAGSAVADEVGLVATGSVALGTISVVVDVVVSVAATGMINHPGSKRVVL